MTQSAPMAMPLGQARFHRHISIVMILLVVLGFGPSFYWRGALDNPPQQLASGWVVLHALANSLWMLLVLVQTALVGAGRGELHRRLGKAGAALAVIVTLLGLRVAFDVIRRDPALLMHADSVLLRFFVSASLVGIVVFAGLVIAALCNVRRSDHHRRYMVLATVVVITASFARLPIIGPIGPPLTALPLLLLLGWIAWHDRSTLGRVHPANWRGFVVIIGMVVLVNVLARAGGLHWILDRVIA
jgi:hypothetical protein